ncbi:uncharacterized protein BDZ99DRAFT_470886 [Mytilinidion resinicola]|uniref:Uncharacterized protein n=1 Tax=Mytilinidion resinicola TaxID=574789 RepID=A0A6A6ZB76_9PEZI|nr:uncharacterized protein BDZ99DRAFT_470886 [Mytilinidion resinicola]KAF2817953.1 hypothetical protein BDZ99DRAFT_470886 [Mytilinidion resinicola]
MSQPSPSPPTEFPLFRVPQAIRVLITSFAVSFPCPLEVHRVAAGHFILTNLPPPSPISPAATANLPGTVDDLPLLIALRGTLHNDTDAPELRDHRAEFYHHNTFVFDTLELDLATMQDISPVRIGFGFRHLRRLVLSDLDPRNGLPGLAALAALKGLENVTIAARGLIEWQDEWQYGVGHEALESFGVREQVLRVVDLVAVLVARSRSGKWESLLRVECGGVESLRCVEHQEDGFCEVERIEEEVGVVEMRGVVQERVRRIRHTLGGRPMVEGVTHDERMAVVQRGGSWVEEQEDGLVGAIEGVSL